MSSAFVFALLPFDCVSVQIWHFQRRGGVVRVGCRVVFWFFILLLNSVSRTQPFRQPRILFTDFWQGVKQLFRIQRVWFPLAWSHFCVFVIRLLGWPKSGLFTGTFVWQVGYPRLLAGQRVGVFLGEGMFWAVCWGGVRGVSQWADLGLRDSQEVLLWLKQSPAKKEQYNQDNFHVWVIYLKCAIQQQSPPPVTHRCASPFSSVGPNITSK